MRVDARKASNSLMLSNAAVLGVSTKDLKTGEKDIWGINIILKTRFKLIKIKKTEWLRLQTVNTYVCEPIKYCRKKND